MLSNEQKILSQLISDLPFPEDFKSVSKKLGFKTIGDMAARHVNELLESDGFTYHMLQEYTQFMQENNLSHLIKQH
jgi:hypothetical protein